MKENDEGGQNHFRLIEAPEQVVHGLAIVRNTSRGIVIGDFLRLDLTSIEPEVLLVRISPLPLKEEPAPEQILKWNTPYNFEGTNNYLVAELDMHPSHAYPNARIKLDFPADVKILRDELVQDYPPNSRFK